jgi:hypothetical protein
VAVDHRVFSQTGRSEMGNELKELPGNAVKVSRNGYKDTVNAGKAVVDTVTHGGDSREDVVTRYQGYRRNLHVASEIDELSMDQGVEALNEDVKAIAQAAIESNGLKGDVEVVLYSEMDGRLGGHKDGVVYLNMAYQNGDKDRLTKVLGDELSHYVDYKKGVPYTEKRQAVSTLYGDDAGDQMRNYGGDEAGGYVRFQERMAEYDFTKANERVRRVDGMEERVFLYEDRVVATDGQADAIVVMINEAERDQIVATRYADDSGEYDTLYSQIRKEFSDNGMIGSDKIAYKKGQVIQLDSGYRSSGKEYDLNKVEDKSYLLSQTDMSYYGGEQSMLHYQNGMNNSEKGARQGASMMEALSGERVGVIHNDTAGIVGDAMEYLPNHLSLKDVMNANRYEEIAQANDGSVVVAFSAGNEDGIKAMEVLKLQNKHLDGRLKFVSVGSPVTKTAIEEAGESVGIRVLGQYNDWKDPVTNGKTWLAGATAITVGAAGGVGIMAGAWGANATAGWLTASTALEQAANIGLGGAVGGAVGFGGIKTSLKQYHSFEGYVNRDVNGLKTDLSKGFRVEMP